MSRGEVRDRRTFYLYTIVVTGLTAVIALMFFDMWTSGGYDLLNGLATAIPFIPDGEPGVEAVVLFLFGLLITWLGLFAHDYRKRYQGALLLIGTLIVLVVMTALGRGVQNINPTLTNLGSFLAGVALGILSEGVEIETEEDNGKFQGNLRDIDFGESMFLRAMLINGDYAEFPIASLGLVYLVQGLVVVGNLVNIVVNGLTAPIITFVYIVGSGLFLFFFDKFIDIDVPPSERNFEVLGPQQSGKTYFALGLYRTVLEHPKKYEQKDVDKAMIVLNNEYNEGRRQYDPPLPWKIIDATDRQLYQLEFSFLTKRRFPTLVNAEMRDHPGEVLQMIGNLFEFGNVNGDTNNRQTATDGGRDVEDDDDDEDDDSGLEWWEEPSADDEEEDAVAPDEEDDVFNGDGELEDGEESSNYADYVANEDGSNVSVSLDEDAEDDDAAFPDEDDEDEEIDVDDAAFPDEDDEDEEIDVDDAAFPDEDDEDEETDFADPIEEEKVSSQAEVETDREEIAKQMRENIRGSDKLVFLLDSERFYGFDPTGSGGGGLSMEDTAMVHIAKNANVDEIILVASKADFFIDDWKESRDHRAQPQDSPAKFRDFREYVERRFVNEAGIDPLTANANTSIIHPVYFATEDVEGEPLLKTNDNGHIIPVGFEEVLDELAQ
ncbi:cation:proton antiporter family protein [Salinigranum halophilum]|uniref:hypothetical protein n=1 Tax=Salinigranum halophilum TaxID=2565931 RepID=UPI00115ECD87|nr:hypothetical protein [Salinigranum halophilum]